MKGCELMGRIIQLDEALSNMIAAGEVVENMASVVKELTENALDAGSTAITINLKNYGLKSIEVIDNGSGMDQDDLTMAFKRHATSKIKTHHDLHHIASLGFRGEALPSISSVAEMTIESTDQSAPSLKLTLKNGTIIDTSPGSIKQGTRIQVKNLFYNTPARLKHLKSEHKELSYIVDYVNKLALSHAHVRFTLTHDNKTLLSTTGDNDTLKILHQIYDTDIVKAMLPFEAQNQYFKIKGYLTKPLYTRSTRQHITLSANHRLIKNNQLLKSVVEGYGTRLTVGKYPIVFIQIIVDPLLIDVNIHPQKLEVKFTEEYSLRSLIKNTINQTLQGVSLIHSVSSQPKKHTQYTIPLETYKKDQNETPTQHDDTTKTVKETKPQYNREQINDSQQITDENIKSKEGPNIKALDYIGQFRGTYLLFQSDDGLFMVDQHAAAERIRYEQYYQKMQKGSHQTRALLIPIKVHLSKDEVIAYQDHVDTLASFGLSTTLTKDNAVIIDTIPGWFHSDKEEDYTETMIRKLLNEDDVSIGIIIDQLAKDLSCKHSIRANKYITKEEVDRLMKDLNQCHNPYTCPHGRPTILHFSQDDIETMFKRIQS